MLCYVRFGKVKLGWVRFIALCLAPLGSGLLKYYRMKTCNFRNRKLYLSLLVKQYGQQLKFEAAKAESSELNFPPLLMSRSANRGLDIL